MAKLLDLKGGLAFMQSPHKTFDRVLTVNSAEDQFILVTQLASRKMSLSIMCILEIMHNHSVESHLYAFLDSKHRYYVRGIVQDNLSLTSQTGDKASEISKKIVTKFRSFLALVVLVGALPKALEYAKFPLRPIYARSLMIGSLAILSISLVVKIFSVQFWRSLLNSIRFATKNLWIWIFGNVEQRDRLKDIHLLTKDVHLVTKFLQESTLFARVVDLKPGVTSKYFILFSHKEEKDGSNHHIGHGDRYRIPGFPVDEAECIIRLWYLAASSLHLSWTDIQAQCGCTWKRVEERERILGGSLAIVGSAKKNAYAAELMNQLKQLEGNQINRQVRFYLEMHTETNTCYLNGDNKFGKELMPDSTDNCKTGDQLTDYALLMKLPNLFAEASQKSGTVLLLAGCKVAGQVALTDWLSEPSNMGNLVSTYGTDPFQIAFKIKYKYVEGGLPSILEAPQELHREKISVQPKVASATAGSR